MSYKPRHFIKVSGQPYAPAALPRDRISLAIKWEAAWAPEPLCTVWMGENLLSLAGLKSHII
jgi:hypothetical protein